MKPTHTTADKLRALAKRKAAKFYGHTYDENGAQIGEIWSGNKEVESALLAAAELVEVADRARRLSIEHVDFKLYAMEPYEQALAKLEEVLK